MGRLDLAPHPEGGWFRETFRDEDSDGSVTSTAIYFLLGRGERPQFVVPAGHWQAAETLGDWTLVGCTVAPGFDFTHFELAPPHWRPSEA